MPDAQTAKPLDGVSTVALIFLFSFAIQRVVRGILFGLAYLGWFDPEAKEEALEDETPAQAERRQRLLQRKASLWYFLLSGGAAVAILTAFDLNGILSILGLKASNHWLDFGLTVLVLAAGAESLGDVFKSYGAPKASKPEPPLMVTGTLHFDDRTIQLKANNPSAGPKG